MNRILLALLFLPVFLSAQERLSLQAPRYCQYLGDSLETELYRFESAEDVPQAVARILGWAGRPEANFKLVQSNAGSAVAVLDGDKRYLLYSADFFYDLNPLETYALLAHEIVHLLNGHRFESCCRRGEELEADEFMGYILYCAHLTDSVSAVGMADWQRDGRGFGGHGLSVEERRRAIAQGWSRGETVLNTRSELSFYDNKSNTDMAGLKAFPWPPPTCAQRYTLAQNLSARFANLAEVNTWLCKSLDNRRYWSRSYHHLPRGFALVTRLEQFRPADGRCMPEAQRWVDYPAVSFEGGIMDYLKALIFPNKGYFRVFVLAVTDRNAGSNGKKIGREEARKWLDDATSNLPYEIGQLPVTKQHFVEVLVYEFETRETDRKCLQRCSGTRACREHLTKAGLKF